MDMIAESCNFEIPTDSRHLPRYEMTKEERESMNPTKICLIPLFMKAWRISRNF